MLDGFEDCIGTRTDIWVTYDAYLNGLINWDQKFPQPETWLMTMYFEGRYERWKQTERGKLPNVHAISDAQAHEISEYWCWEAEPGPSTGLMAMLVFRPCTIVGFDHFEASLHHYWDTDLYKEDYHRHGKEREIVERLIAEGTVT